SPCDALLRMPLLVWVGRRSYALYLWHLPVFYLAGPLWRPGAEALEVKALAWAVCFALAAGSFVYLEQPALRLKHRLVHGSLQSRRYERPTTSSSSDSVRHFQLVPVALVALCSIPIV